MDPSRFVILSGCSSGGKSTLLAELARRGFATVEEPGRRIVREAPAGEGAALPWIDEAAFARRAIDVALADRAAADGHRGWTFFDRGLIDAASALDHLTGGDALRRLGRAHPYHRRVFLAHPGQRSMLQTPSGAMGSTRPLRNTRVCSATIRRWAMRWMFCPRHPSPRAPISSCGGWRKAEARAARMGSQTLPRAAFAPINRR